MSNIFTLAGAHGKAIGGAQPVAGSVPGSPFTTAAGSASTGKLTGLAIIVCTANNVHVRFDKDVGVAATTNDILIPTNQHFSIPCDGHVMSFVQASGGSGLLYVELAREVEV